MGAAADAETALATATSAVEYDPAITLLLGLPDAHPAYERLFNGQRTTAVIAASERHKMGWKSTMVCTLGGAGLLFVSAKRGAKMYRTRGHLEWARSFIKTDPELVRLFAHEFKPDKSLLKVDPKSGAQKIELP